MTCSRSVALTPGRLQLTFTNYTWLLPTESMMMMMMVTMNMMVIMMVVIMMVVVMMMVILMVVVMTKSSPHVRHSDLLTKSPF